MIIAVFEDFENTTAYNHTCSKIGIEVKLLILMHTKNQKTRSGSPETDMLKLDERPSGNAHLSLH